MYEQERAEYARDREATPMTLASVGIGEMIGELISTFDTLETRLIPVLRSGEPVAELARERELKPIETSSPHVVDLHRHQEHLQDLRQRMVRVLDRLDV